MEATVFVELSAPDLLNIFGIFKETALDKGERAYCLSHGFRFKTNSVKLFLNISESVVALSKLLYCIEQQLAVLIIYSF